MGHKINYYVDSKIAIRSAMGNLGFTGMYQTMLPELHRWAAEAQNRICENRQSLPMVTDEIIIYNNQIALKRDFCQLENLTINGYSIPYSNQSKSSPLVTVGSPTRTSQPHQRGVVYNIDQYYITFDPAVQDGTVAKLQHLVRPVDADGFPMIIYSCAEAIALYVGSRMCKRMKDNRYENENREWLFACRQARARVNEMIQEQLENIGAAYIGFGNHDSFDYWGTWAGY